MNGEPMLVADNARYAKLRREVGKVYFHIRYLVWRGVTNLSLLRTRTNLFPHGVSEKQVIGKGLVQFLCAASNQPYILTLYV